MVDVHVTDQDCSNHIDTIFLQFVVQLHQSFIAIGWSVPKAKENIANGNMEDVPVAFTCVIIIKVSDPWTVIATVKLDATIILFAGGRLDAVTYGYQFISSNCTCLVWSSSQMSSSQVSVMPTLAGVKEFI